jgi:hypothetical protein
MLLLGEKSVHAVAFFVAMVSGHRRIKNETRERVTE